MGTLLSRAKDVKIFDTKQQIGKRVENFTEFDMSNPGVILGDIKYRDNYINFSTPSEHYDVDSNLSGYGKDNDDDYAGDGGDSLQLNGNDLLNLEELESLTYYWCIWCIGHATASEPLAGFGMITSFRHGAAEWEEGHTDLIPGDI